MTQEEMIQALADLKERQLAGENLPCPRCGEYSMKPSVCTNALSRRADVYICDRDGVIESLEAAFDKLIPLEEWAYFRAK